MSKVNARQVRRIRHRRLRAKLSGGPESPRLCVFRSLNHIYAQIVDDLAGSTLVSVSTLDPNVKGELSGKTKTARAELVGSLVSQRAKDRGISRVVFDRGGYKYHGRVKALAEAARAGGLEF